MAGLNPPRIKTEDPGTHEMDASSEDHFSSASEGDSVASAQDPKRLTLTTSPIPTTRVERVDDEPAHGEVPGTPAYRMRMQDAVPDEIEVVPEGQQSRSRSRATSRLSESDRPQISGTVTPGGTPVPRTVVDRVDDEPAYGEVKGTEAFEMRKHDAEPDEVRKLSGEMERPNGRSDIESGRQAQEYHEIDEEGRQAWFRNMWESGGQEDKPAADDAEDEGADDFGDDFDEFAEGGGDDDFGDFDDGFQEEEETTVSQPAQTPQPQISNPLEGLPPLDFASCTSKADIHASIQPYLDVMFPDTPVTPSDAPPPIDPIRASPFLSDRSLSLWQQLVSPPPMQPVNWTRSRIRRLFLVSLGVPVDLDEILPPSKQKRLVLPNINLSSSPRPSTALDRLKQESNSANASSTSVDSKATDQRGKRKPKTNRSGPAPPPEFDTNAASLLSSTTEAAMRGWTHAELKEHMRVLEDLNQRASKVLEYWLQRKDEAIKEKEALEGVIENLVGFVKARGGR